MEWAIFGALFTVIMIALGIMADGMRQKRKIRVQEMLQRERLAAMEKGLPMPDWGPGMLGEDGLAPASPEVHARRLEWFRFTSLCTGIVLAFAGLGMMLAFHLSDDSGFHEMASLGVIPLMTGLGLLLFSLITRKQQT